MSFGFQAVGTREDVVRQLEAHAAGKYNAGTIAEDVARLLAGRVHADRPDLYGSADGEYRYVVKASGHSGGGSPLSLNASVEAHYVPVPAEADANEGSEDAAPIAIAFEK